VQFEDVPVISYDQNKWNAASQYDKFEGEQVVSFWAAYNKHLIGMMRNIPAGNLSRQCDIGKGGKVTLEWIINDYIRHLEHHLHQVVQYQ